MKEFILKNGIKILYEYRVSNISSFCIGFNAGALEEEGFNAGIAHVVEHMVFKGTKNRSEKEINNRCDELFGFHNAMTNYPYAIYYGTMHSINFKEGLEIYGDIVMNPSFKEEGFNEEIMVIKEELTDWKEDVNQHCEDMLLKNSFSKRRIKELIIGNEESINKINIEEVKRFYSLFYCPQNCVISVVSSLNEQLILKIVDSIMGSWDKRFIKRNDTYYENNVAGIFVNDIEGLQGGKIQYCFPIHTLSEEEVIELKLLNLLLGDGVSSILYDSIRTQKGLAYEINSEVKAERGIKLFKINLSTSKDKVKEAINIIDDCLVSFMNNQSYRENINLEKLINRCVLKNELSIEKSIELCKKLTTEQLMFNSSSPSSNQCKIEDIEKLYKVANKILKNPSIQILK